MIALPETTVDRQRQPESYRDNFSRHLLGVSRHVQNSMMNTLQNDCGHSDLRLGYAPYITLLGTGNMRLTQLAEILGISRQACNQAVKQIETAGYLQRESDPADRRAKQLSLSERGHSLRRDGTRVVTALDNQFAAIVGERALQDAGKSVRELHRALGLSIANDPAAQSRDIALAGLLPRLSDYILRRLMELSIAKGHPGLKLSFGQVLTLIGPGGGRIQHMAAVHDVSKQAISVIATELETLGYLKREVDPADARQVVLQFTDAGHALIEDSMASVRTLAAEFIAIIDEAPFRRLTDTIHQLYDALKVEREMVEGSAPGEIPALAQQLKQQLGQHGSQELARLLLHPAQVNEV